LAEVQRTLPTTEANSPYRRRRIKRLQTHYLSIVSLCFVLSVTCTVFEVFVLFNIEYCDGEDLIKLYWGFWSTMQVGSNIAIFGVILQLWIVLGSVQTPSWAVALGTPVLVFAALGWVCREISKQACKRVLRMKVSENDDDADGDSRVGEKRGLENWLSRAYFRPFLQRRVITDSCRPTVILESDHSSGPVSMINIRRHSTA